MLNTILIWFILIFGILLMYFSFDIDGKLPTNCKSKALRNSNKGLLILGVLFTTISSAILIAPQVCDCSKFSLGQGPIEIYAVFIFLLAIVTLVLTSVIKSNMKKENNCLTNTQSANAVLTISIIMLVLSSSVLGMSMYSKYSTTRMPTKTSAA
jgi:4-hydroxybenzoate polyprenyltransferase